MSNEHDLRSQYRADNLADRLLDDLRRLGKDPDALSRDDLMPFEEFHVGGRAETRRLAELIPELAGSDILDIGCGIGGPARTLAAEYDCRAIGVDISLDYCRTAAMLSKLIGMDERTNFVCGAAPELPFSDSSCDVIWLQHTGMNIADKEQLTAEIARLLRPGGRLAMHELFSNTPEKVHYPVFWADSETTSFMESPEAARSRFVQHGFEIITWDDITAEAAAWFERVIRRFDEKGVPPLSLQLVVGESFEAKARNVYRNLAEQNVSMAVVVLRRDG